MFKSPRARLRVEYLVGSGTQDVSIARDANKGISPTCWQVGCCVHPCRYWHRRTTRKNEVKLLFGWKARRPAGKLGGSARWQRLRGGPKSPKPPPAAPCALAGSPLAPAPPPVSRCHPAPAQSNPVHRMIREDALQSSPVQSSPVQYRGRAFNTTPKVRSTEGCVHRGAGGAGAVTARAHTPSYVRVGASCTMHHALCAMRYALCNVSDSRHTSRGSHRRHTPCPVQSSAVQCSPVQSSAVQWTGLHGIAWDGTRRTRVRGWKEEEAGAGME
eukprot:1176553-Prorocentrum_minimum.AAC.5